MPEFIVKLEFSCEADSAEDAANQYVEWISTGARTVQIWEIGEPGSTEFKL